MCLNLFYLELKYDGQFTGMTGDTIQKNGNINQLMWRTRGRERQAYNFNYDHLDRLRAAVYADVNDAGTVTLSKRYNESLAYADARGNIGTLKRQGGQLSGTCWNFAQIDNLGYSYQPGTNRVSTISDAASATYKAKGFNPGAGTGSYAYDVNGNPEGSGQAMTADPYKAMTIAYNHLNLPRLFTWTGGGYQGNSVEILYDAAGTKLRKTVKTGATVNYVQDYIGGIEYRDNVREAIYTAEGRVFHTSPTTTRYEYTLKDHLGNSRLSFSDLNGNGAVDVTASPGTNELLQENHYYPFGLGHDGPWVNDAARDNRYQYNGKEWNDDFGLNLNDYGARWYDAGVGRWWSVDPMLEMSFSENPYAYGGNNPIKNIDFGGLFKINPKGSFPMFEKYLQSGDIGRLLQNADLRNGLKTLGNFSDEQLDKMATYDEGPEIYIVQDEQMLAGGFEINGKFRNSEGEGSFYISKELVEQFESASPEDKQATLLLVMMTVFHESVHLGVNKNGLPKDANYGNWEKRGDVYKFNGNPVGFKEGADWRSYEKNPKYRGRNMTTEDGQTLENIIWYLGNTKRGEEGKKEAKDNKKTDVVPRA